MHAQQIMQDLLVIECPFIHAGAAPSIYFPPRASASAIVKCCTFFFS